MRFNQVAKTEYAADFKKMVIRPEHLKEIKMIATKIVSLIPQYAAVKAATGCPEDIFAIIHLRECSLDFKKHIHNGDPLTGRTTHVPAGRPIPPPKSGHFPYTFLESAIDCMNYQAKRLGFDLAKMAWDIPEAAFWFEAMNGFGYRPHGVKSPYLWSYSNLYSKGLFTADGHYSKDAVSRQIGAMPLLVVVRQMLAKPMAISEVVDFPTDAEIMEILNAPKEGKAIDMSHDDAASWRLE